MWTSTLIFFPHTTTNQHNSSVISSPLSNIINHSEKNAEGSKTMHLQKSSHLFFFLLLFLLEFSKFCLPWNHSALYNGSTSEPDCSCNDFRWNANRTLPGFLHSELQTSGRSEFFCVIYYSVCSAIITFSHFQCADFFCQSSKYRNIYKRVAKTNAEQGPSLTLFWMFK